MGWEAEAGQDDHTISLKLYTCVHTTRFESEKSTWLVDKRDRHNRHWPEQTGIHIYPKAGRPFAGYRGGPREMACSTLVPNFSSYPARSILYLFQSYSLPQESDIRKFWVDSWILELPADFSPRGTPTGDGGREYLRLWSFPIGGLTLDVSSRCHSVLLAR